MEYCVGGSQLVKQTVLFCNGPYFSYQVNNLIVLPFSLFLLIVFSLFNNRESFCIMQNKYLSCGGRNRPGLPSAVNPFQRRNRLLIAAIFCIIANEIFKMIEASMFSAAVNDDLPSFNSTTEFFLSSIGHKEHSYGNKDLLRMGLGIEPTLMHEQMDKKKNLLVKLLDRLGNGSASSTKPAVLFAPSVLRYSKPRLPPRLNVNDFQTTTTPQTLSSDLELSLRVVNGINTVKTVKNQTLNIIESFNKTLNGSSTKTLFQVSMSLYQNEYVQNALKTMFKYRGFKWNIVLDKLQRLAFMLIEVLIIGMRYYPLLGVLDKNSLVCTLLASLYMWADTLYNVVMTGMCEGLKLNMSLDLLRDLRRIFGVGFIYDVKEHYTSNVRPPAADHLSPVDTNLLFSTNRIVYTVIKSLPHYFCLSYVTIRFSATFLKQLYKKLNRKSNQTRENLVYDALKSVGPNKIELVYTRKYSVAKSKRASSFEDRYVNQLFKSKDRINADQSWLFKIGLNNDTFRYSTRIICTYTVCFTVLYYLSCFLVFYGAIFIDLIYFPFVYKCSVLVSACLALLICFVQLVLSMIKFKLHLSSLYKGTSDKYISSKSLFTNKKIATSSFNYSGYAVTYTCWGYLFLFMLCSFISFQLATLFVFGSNAAVGLFMLVVLVPFSVSVILIRLVSRLLSSIAARFCFLQRKSKVLALKNLKSYSLFLYFKFFYDCFTGIAFCLLRMLKSICLAVLFMSRIDYSFMGRSMESMDPAFMSYIGYLHWEAHHTNPIAISFCELLRQSLRSRRKQATSEKAQLIRRNRIVNRWQLCCLLLKNKKLISLRKHT